MLTDKQLKKKATRIKWKAAKVVGNIVHCYPNQLGKPIKNLLVNTENAGTVVRWSAAFALTQIIQLKTKHNNIVVRATEAIYQKEPQNSIKSVYFGTEENRCPIAIVPVPSKYNRSICMREIQHLYEIKRCQMAATELCR